MNLLGLMITKLMLTQIDLPYKYEFCHFRTAVNNIVNENQTQIYV